MPPPRIAPLEQPTDEVRELLELVPHRDGEPLNIFRTLAKHPRLLRRFNALGGTLLEHGLVPARERELVILRVGDRCGSVYEFGQHTVLGEAAGLTDAEIARLACDDIDGWTIPDRLLVALADELCAGDHVSDATWCGLAARWSDPELVELLILAGFYRMVCGFLNAAGVQPESGVPGWPPGRDQERDPLERGSRGGR